MTVRHAAFLEFKGRSASKPLCRPGEPGGEPSPVLGKVVRAARQCMLI